MFAGHCAVVYPRYQLSSGRGGSCLQVTVLWCIQDINCHQEEEGHVCRSLCCGVSKISTVIRKRRDRVAGHCAVVYQRYQLSSGRGGRGLEGNVVWYIQDSNCHQYEEGRCCSTLCRE